ncbi:MAG: YitT family protein [Pelolinea sp.]|nr:YitT family protein [Pelolinea sp.]
MLKKISSRKYIFLDYFFIAAGAFVQALAMRLFLIPGLMVSGGISGASQIINYFTKWPIGVMVLVGNLPLLVLGWRYLGGRRFALRTATAVFLFSVFTDGLAYFLPLKGATTDKVLVALYGGVVLGIGLGLVYRGRGTSGGSDILGRILNHYRGIAISQAYLITDGLVVLASGFAFGWDKALYALFVIYISGMAAELVSEGNNLYRMAFIITSEHKVVARQILTLLERGVTIMPGTGGYSNQSRPVLYCVLTRAEVNLLKAIVHEADPDAFMVIGQANEALGEGFRPFRKTTDFRRKR